MRVLEGNFSGKGLKVGIVAGRFNEFITSKLIGGALDALKRHEAATKWHQENMTSPGFPEHLKFLWLLRKWHNQENMTL